MRRAASCRPRRRGAAADDAIDVGSDLGDDNNQRPDASTNDGRPHEDADGRPSDGSTHDQGAAARAPRRLTRGTPLFTGVLAALAAVMQCRASVKGFEDLVPRSPRGGYAKPRHCKGL